MRPPNQLPGWALRSRPADRCAVCGDPGTSLYTGLEDRLFGVPGSWSVRRCAERSCGLLWLDPAPISEDIGLAYRSYYTHRDQKRIGRSLWFQAARTVWLWVKFGYLSRRFGYTIPAGTLKRLLALVLEPFPTRRECLDVAAMYLDPCPGARIVDVGTGDGSTLELLRDLGWAAEGLDVDPEAVAAARRKGLEVRFGSLGAQQYPSESFAAVTMSHVIEHLHDPAAALAECRRILRPGGRLVVLTPNASSLAHARFGSSWRGLEPPRHLQVFTPGALWRTAERAGLRVLELASTARMASVIYRESCALQHEGILGRGGARISGLAFQIVERINLRKNPWAGEELVLVAERSSRQGEASAVSRTVSLTSGGVSPRVPPLVGIVILHWNNYLATSRLLDGLKHVTYSKRRVYVLDNGSTDASMDRLEAEWRDAGLILLRNGVNLGFAAGVNRGIKRAVGDGCDYVLLVNNDCVVTDPGFLDPLVARAESDPTIGLVSGKLVRWPETGVLWSTGGFVSWRGARYVGLGEPDRGQYELPEMRGFLSGALLLIPRRVVETVGALPEEYFFGHEDRDYSVQVARKGFRLFYEPRSVIAHEAGGSHEGVDPTYLYNDVLSRILFQRRNLAPISYAFWRISYALYVVLAFPMLAWLAPGRYLSGAKPEAFRRAALAALRDARRLECIRLETLEAFRALEAGREPR